MISTSWPADLKSLTDIQAFIEKWGKKQGVSPEKTTQISLLLEEVVVNIVSYAFEDQKGRFIDLDIESGPDEIRLCISDSGIPFNPLEKDDPDLEADLMDRPVGGLGIYLIRQYTRHVDYERRDNKNYLTMVIGKED